MVATPWGESESLRERMLRPGPSASPEEVTGNQKERLFGAMVACVAELGYEATRVADLVEISGVSSRSFYDLFPNKEACFVAAFEAILEKEPLDTYDSFARMLAAQPAAATMCLVEAHAAGPAAGAALDAAVAGFEKLTRARASGASELAGLPVEMFRAHLGALQEIARTRLRERRQEEVASLVPQLAQVVNEYRSPLEPLRLATRAPAFGPESVAAHDDAERALRAFAVVVAERGYGGATIHEVAKQGSMSPSTFYANFRDKEDALLAAIDSAGAQLVTATMTAFHRSADWGAAVRAAIGSGLNFLASRPAMAQLLAVELFAGGMKAVARRGQTLSPLAGLLAQGYRIRPETPPIATEAIAGGIAELVNLRIRKDGPASLPALAPICAYIALAPFLGAERATEVANGDGRGRTIQAMERETLRDLLAVQPTKRSALATLILRSASAEELARELKVSVETIGAYLEELEEERLIERVEVEDGDESAPPAWRFRSSLRLFDLEEWAELTPEERHRVSTEVVELIERDFAQSLADGSFDRRADRHLTRTPIVVDEQGWSELVSIHLAAAGAAYEIRTKSAKRLKESGGKAITGRSVQALFELPDE
jgi:AcrR family transcriptional regulator/Mn-dependent DtxR family transcriptional regulator